MYRMIRMSLLTSKSRKLVAPKTRISCLRIQHRSFGYIPSALLPPLVFTGLLVALWAWKCLMLILFQNKIIYMPYLPLNARNERIKDYKKQCGGIEWREEKIRSRDGTAISLVVTSVITGLKEQVHPSAISSEQLEPVKRTYILYFQGNDSSIPPRLPFLSPIPLALRNTPHTSPKMYIFVCLSYRGYWTSSGRPSERGFNLDAEAALEWVKEDAKASKDDNVELIFWGASIGASIATTLASSPLLFLKPRLLFLETPFLSLRAMISTIYPQKWLPYRHLHPFLMSHLDTYNDLAKLETKTEVMIVVAGQDELVPEEHGRILEERCRELGLRCKRVVVSSVLHTAVMGREDGRKIIVKAIMDVQ